MLRGLVRTAASFLLLAACSAASAQNTVMLFLSSADPGSLPTPPGFATPQPPELGTPLTPVPNLGESARLYIWASAQTGVAAMSWNAVSFNIDIDGPATLSNLTLFNPSHIGQSRWNVGGLFAPAPVASGTEYNNVLMLAASEYGVRRVPYSDGYTAVSGGFPVAGAAVLLGYFDVTFAQTTLATVWLEVGALDCQSTDGLSNLDRVKLGNGETGFGTPVNSASGTRCSQPAAIFNIPAPGAFTLVAPATGRYIINTSPTLTWTPAQNAQTYSVRISTNASMSSPILTQTGVNGLSFNVPPGVLTTGVYHWSVNAHNTGGPTTASNGPFDFGVISGQAPDCGVDFDNNGTVGVADIFAFLSEWFAGCPRGQRGVMEHQAAAAKGVGFTESFGAFDILWVVLALGSAFTIGRGGGGGDEDEDEDED